MFSKEHYHGNGLQYYVDNMTQYISTRKLRKVVLTVGVSVVGLWLIWKMTMQRKGPTSAVGCKNRLAEVNRTKMFKEKCLPQLQNRYDN